MSRPRNPFPAYLRHSTRDQALAHVRRHDGVRTKVYFPGKFGSEESKAAYRELLKLLQFHGGRLPPRPGQTVTDDVTIAVLALKFLEEKVEIDYIDAKGRPTSEQFCFRQALKPLVRLFGSAPARDFDSPSLEKIRESMINGSWMKDAERERLEKANRPINWSRGNINKAVSRIRSMFRWAVVKKIVPASVVTDLECLPPLRKGRGGVRETDPVVPVDPAVVEQTIPYLPPVVADMVRVQILTGCRPGELCAMRGVEIDRTGPVWLYTPERHKTAHRGHLRTIAIGPKAQLILRRYIKQDANAFMFSPAEQDRLIKEAKRAARKSKVQPSQVDRRVRNPKRKPADRFGVTAYNRAVVRAARKAGVMKWHAHQLRHTAALLIEREHGAEAARAVLGHKTLNMTLHYSGIDTKRASDVAAKIG